MRLKAYSTALDWAFIRYSTALSFHCRPCWMPAMTWAATYCASSDSFIATYRRILSPAPFSVHSSLPLRPLLF